MPRSRFVPDGWVPREKDILWAMKKFNISRDEVARQAESFIDYEFKRAYSDWNRAFRNWFRTGDKYQLLMKERQYRKPEQLTDEQREADILAFEKDPLIRRALDK